MRNTLLDGIRQEDKQKIFECLSQAIGEDRQEADAVLDLKTHVSDAFLNWDLIYRNLINAFAKGNLLISTSKRGMWEVLLLFDEHSGLLLSFMRDNRFKTIKKAKYKNQPQYIRSLLSLNAELRGVNEQQSLFSTEKPEDETQLRLILDELCAGFEQKINNTVANHALVVFSNHYGRIDSLKAYILDRELNVVCEQDWLDSVQPIMSNAIETVDHKDNHHAPVLKQKALERLHEKELVALKEQELEKQA